jgi:hypothetical protein
LGQPHGAIFERFGRDRDKMLEWLHANVPPGWGVKVEKGELVIFRHPYVKIDGMIIRRKTWIKKQEQ